MHLIKLIDRIGEKIHTKHVLFKFSPGPKDLEFLSKKFEGYLKETFNDPGAFDSLCVHSYQSHKNLSGYFLDFNIQELPLFLQKKILNMDDFSFSEVFVEGSSVFLLYKYQQKKTPPLSLELDWPLIEGVALGHKRFNLLGAWIAKEKEYIYIEFFAN